MKDNQGLVTASKKEKTLPFLSCSCNNDSFLDLHIVIMAVGAQILVQNNNISNEHDGIEQIGKQKLCQR